MTEYFTETWRGYCPEFDDDEHPIEVSLMRANFLGGSTLPPTIDHIKCEDTKTCQYLATRKQCPLLKRFSR